MEEVTIRLLIDGVRVTTHPIFNDDLKMSFSRQENNIFHREKVDGKIRFVKEDFRIINSCKMDTKFTLEVYRGSVFVGSGDFYKSDCDFNKDDESCEVKVSTTDRYEKILNAYDNKVNLIRLAPKCEKITLHRRGVAQFYSRGSDKVTNVMGGMYFEQDSAEEMDKTKLQNDYHLAYLFPLAKIKITNVPSSSYESVLGEYTVSEVADNYTIYSRPSTNFTIRVVRSTQQPNYVAFFLQRADSTLAQSYLVEDKVYDDRDITMDTTDSRTFTARYHKDGELYGRILMPKQLEEPSQPYYRRNLDDDLTEHDMNYPYVMPMSRDQVLPLYVSHIEKSFDPTEWGQDSEPTSRYFTAPTLTDEQKSDGVNLIPIAQSHWEYMSSWILLNDSFRDYLDEYTDFFVLRNAYPLQSVIEVLIKNIDPNLKFGVQPMYSEFFSTEYTAESNLIMGYNFPRSRRGYTFITPISNIKKTEYEQAAQRGDISLRQVLDMLRKVYQCYWFIDDDNNFRIEHITYFKNNYSYKGVVTDIDVDVTLMKNYPTKKSWAWGTNSFTYDKTRCPNRYEFSWGGTATNPFNGYPIDIKDEYISNTKEDVRVDNFISDIDYAIINPSDVSDDLFAIMETNNMNEVELVSHRLSAMSPKYKMQNGYLSFLFAETEYYPYDLGGKDAEIEGVKLAVKGTKRFAIQSLIFPCELSEARSLGIVRTELGDGAIDSLEWTIDTKSANAKIFLPIDKDYTEFVRIVASPFSLTPYNIIHNDSDITLNINYAVPSSDGKLGVITTILLAPHSQSGRISVASVSPSHKLVILSATDANIVKLSDVMKHHNGGIAVEYGTSGTTYKVTFNQGFGRDWSYIMITPRADVRVSIITDMSSTENYGYVADAPCTSARYNAEAVANALVSGNKLTDSCEVRRGVSKIIGYTKNFGDSPSEVTFEIVKQI